MDAFLRCMQMNMVGGLRHPEPSGRGLYAGPEPHRKGTACPAGGIASRSGGMTEGTCDASSCAVATQNATAAGQKEHARLHK